MKSLSYVEIDIPVCSLTYGVAPCTASVPTTGARKCFNSIKTCQDRTHFSEAEVTLRFAKSTVYLPRDIDSIPNVQEISFTPATISLGENLGTRATLSVTFSDIKHSDTEEGFDKYFAERDYNPYEQGTFWGKFRARQPFLRGRPIRWITGLDGQSIDQMEVRNFVIESFDGPTPDGKYTLIAKDVLKLVDGDRAMAPLVSTGFLVAPITDVSTTATLSPSGVGDAEYPIEGYVAIGGKEIAAFKRWLYDVNGENDKHTKIMLHMDGSNGGTTFTDSNLGGSTHTWTPTNATTGTSSKKFGTAALVGSTGYLTTPAHADFNIGTNDFEVDFYFNNNGVGAPGYGLCGQLDSAGSIGTMSFIITRQATTGVILATVTNAGASAQIFFTGTTSFAGTSTWNHVALTKSGTSFRLFINGVQEDTTKTLASVNSSTRPFTIGRTGDGGTGFSALIDEFRLSVGAARWISNFTPPAAPYVPAGIVTTGDTLALTARGQLGGGVAQAFNAQDRVQVVLKYTSQDVADIIYDLMVNYGSVPAEFIALSDWKAETAAFLGRLYSAVICEPTSAATLISELIQQGGLCIWWDDIAQKIRLQVLRGIVTDAARFTPDNYISFTTKEQPEKRISQVLIRFGLINPLKSVTDLDNYRSSSLTIDEEAEEDYGGAVIKVINSRWIPALGRTVADRAGAILLSRFRDPPRKLTFDLGRYAQTDVSLGGGYRVASHCLQDETGALVDVPVQVTRLNPQPDRFKVEAEEVLFAASDDDPNVHRIVIDTNSTNVNLRDVHDGIYPAPLSGNVIICRILAGVRVTSVSTSLAAFNVGVWPVGVTVKIILEGVIQGAAGNGGYAHVPLVTVGQQNGLPGGIALFTRKAIELEFPASARLWGGGGGGGGGGSFGGNGGGGGGGAGDIPGLGGYGNFGATAPGTDTTPGIRGAPGPNGYYGGDGGGPGLPGAPGGLSLGGAAGAAIDGNSYVTTTVSGGDQRGPTIN